MNETEQTAQELEKEIVNKGSIAAYSIYDIACIDDSQFGDFYKMSKIMADKYNYVPAYYSVFDCLAQKQNNYFADDKYDLDKLSETERDEALSYLKHGAKRGEEECKNKIRSYIEEKKYFIATDTISLF